MAGWFANETLAAISLGIIFGTIICDLVFEIRPGLAPRDIDAARSYYRGQHTAPLPVNLVLPLAAIYLLGFLGVRALAANDLPSWLWLGALVAVLAVEIVVALPKERRTVARDGRSEHGRCRRARADACAASAPRCIPTWRSQRC